MLHTGCGNLVHSELMHQSGFNCENMIVQRVPCKPSREQEEMGELESPPTDQRRSRPDEMGVVMLLPFHQLRVPPVGESIQVSPSWGGHRDLVTIGPDLQPHQSDEGPQRLVDLRATPEKSREIGNIQTVGGAL